MAEYIFLPVPSAEMADFADRINQRRTYLRMAPLPVLRNRYDSGRGKGLMRAIGLGCLRSLSARDTLYLVLHGTGDFSSQTIGADRVGLKNPLDVKAYTPDAMARVLEAEDLTKGFQNLHMVTCGSGLEGVRSPTAKGAKPVDELYRKSFAKRVFEALKARGYNFIEVTGYLGDVSVGVGDRGFGVTVYKKAGRSETEKGVFDSSWSITYR